MFRPINHLGEEVDMPGDQAALSIQRQRDRFDKEVQANMESRQHCGFNALFSRDICQVWFRHVLGIF